MAAIRPSLILKGCIAPSRRMERLRLMAAARKAGRATLRHRQRVGASLPPVLALTDPARAPCPFRLAAALPRGWGLVWRHYGNADRQTARRLKALCARRGVCLYLSHPCPAGLAAYWPERAWADHHLPASGIGSAHSPDGMRRARKRGLSGILVSTVFCSRSPSAGRPMGPMRWNRRAAHILAQGGVGYGLGGINARNAGRVSEFGGFAAVDAIWNAFVLRQTEAD